MSKGVMKTKPVAKKDKTKPDPYANLSNLELMEHITTITEVLQEVVRRLDDLTKDTDVLNQQVANAYNDYLQEKQELEVHLTRVEEYVNRRKQLSTELAGYSDAFKNRMD
jgi:hypothetical protein